MVNTTKMPVMPKAMISSDVMKPGMFMPAAKVVMFIILSKLSEER